jgi:hypothetical protein
MYFFLKFLDITVCNDAINKYVVEKEKIKMVDERGEINANGGRRAEKVIRDNYRFILPVRASHFRFASKTIFIPEDLCHWCDWRTCHSRRGILDTSRKFQQKILGCAGHLIECHSILRPYVSLLRATSHVLWQHLHASYPSRAYVSVDSKLAAAREVLRVVDELLMNPINSHVDDPSLLIYGHSD